MTAKRKKASHYENGLRAMVGFCDEPSHAHMGAADGTDLPMPGSFVTSTSVPLLSTPAQAQAIWSSLTLAQQTAFIQNSGTLNFPSSSSSTSPTPSKGNGFWSGFWGLTSFAAGAALTYHGYKRDGGVGGALLWGLLGGLVWPVTLPIAVAEGFGKPKR